MRVILVFSTRYLILFFFSRKSAYQIAKSVQVFKDSNEYLGITIAGGKDTKYDKIFLKTVIQNSSAAKSKKLRF